MGEIKNTMGKEIKEVEVLEAKEVKKEEYIPKIVYGSFLREERVNIKPVESGGKWSNLLVAGQDNKKDPFLYNKAKRSYQVPLKTYEQGGGVTHILDDIKRVHILKYHTVFPEGMTQKEFFEKELGTNLNPSLKVDENFWRTDKRSRVTLTRKGLTLNLSEPIDMLKYLILLSDKRRISPSYEEAPNKATYEFMIVDENKRISNKVSEAKIKAEAYTQFSIITSSKDKMINFIKALGRVVPINHDEDWLQNEILNVLENSAKIFLSIVKDPLYEAKIFVQNAIEVGAIIKRGDKRYTLDSGTEIGELADMINYLSNPENQEMKLRIRGKIDLAKK